MRVDQFFSTRYIGLIQRRFVVCDILALLISTIMHVVFIFYNKNV